MKRPLITWLVFAACALTGLGVLGWFSLEMLRLERGAAQAREIAAREENVRLALWRMDSALASVHGLEAARPPAEYEPFVRTATTFTIDLRQDEAGGVLVPSPLLGFTPPFVRLHLQLHDTGTLSSPQVPEGQAYLAALEADIDRGAIRESTIRLEQIRASDASQALFATLQIPREESMARREAPAGRDLDLDAPVPAKEVDDLAAAAPPIAAAAPVQQAAQQLAPQAERQASVELMKNQAEQQKRAVLADDNYYNLNRLSSQRARVPESTLVAKDEDASAAVVAASESELSEGRVQQFSRIQEVATPAPAGARSNESKRAAAKVDQVARADDTEAASRGYAAPSTGSAQPLAAAAPPTQPAAAKIKVAELIEETTAGPLQVIWAGGELFFMRRVDGSAHVRAQAVWLDWPELRAWLLTRVTDLLPGASLEPVAADAAFTLDDASRRLAFLPVRLRPGIMALAEPGSWSPLRTSLGIAWGFAGVGVVALALLLAGTLRLSERRGAFVSAVTHELRTPLTTFRMYTEMLASGMVPDESKRRGYLDTLRKEAERLSHLVENVLSYARLERGRASRRVEDTTPGDLFARIEERLRQRAEQGGLALSIAFDPGAAELPLRTDTTAFEQIVFNLVDNAAKYARRPDGAGALTISIGAGTHGRTVVRVGDNGPGIAASVRKRLFQPFSKSATEAAHSQPGVGLGLALSRRLARDELHGELALERTGPEGTVFRLET